MVEQGGLPYLISYLADQVEAMATRPRVRAEQQLLLDVVEEQLAESRRTPDVARDLVASLIGLRVQLRRALALDPPPPTPVPLHEPSRRAL